MSACLPLQPLTIPDFEPEALALADAYPMSQSETAAQPDDPATISVGLNGADLAYVYMAIDPPGEAVLTRERWEDLRLTHSVWLDLRPAEALELATRLRICAEAVARFAEAFPEEPDEADGTDDRTVANKGANSDICSFPEQRAT